MGVFAESERAALSGDRLRTAWEARGASHCQTHEHPERIMCLVLRDWIQNDSGPPHAPLFVLINTSTS
jgi:hypothetical protein